MAIECVLISMSLCHAVHDKPVMLLGATQATVAIADGVTTRQFEARGYVERNPLMGTNPGWQRMVPAGAAEVLVTAWLAERMRNSRHPWIRRVWRVPQAAAIGVHGYAVARNHKLR